jgi:hypothetical protein
MVLRALARGIPYVVVSFDSLYGPNSRLPERRRGAGIEYYADIRARLRAAFLLPSLSPDQAAQLVVKRLDNRTRSRRSRLKHRSGSYS